MNFFSRSDVSRAEVKDCMAIQLPSGNQTWQLKGLYLFDDLIAVSEGKCYSAIWRCNCQLVVYCVDRCCGWEWLAPSDGTHVHIFVGPWLATVRVCGTCENPCPRPAGERRFAHWRLSADREGKKMFLCFSSQWTNKNGDILYIPIWYSITSPVFGLKGLTSDEFRESAGDFTVAILPWGNVSSPRGNTQEVTGRTHRLLRL